jgi:hypothetical protein
MMARCRLVKQCYELCCYESTRHGNLLVPIQSVPLTKLTTRRRIWYKAKQLKFYVTLVRGVRGIDLETLDVAKRFEESARRFVFGSASGE